MGIFYLKTLSYRKMSITPLFLIVYQLTNLSESKKYCIESIDLIKMAKAIIIEPI